jgi:hypothetical protein
MSVTIDRPAWLNPAADLDKAWSDYMGALGKDARKYAGEDDRFGFWLFALDMSLRSRRGFSVFDLEDYCWRDLFDDGMSPGEAYRAFRDSQ